MKTCCDADNGKLTHVQDAFGEDASSVAPPMMDPLDTHKSVVDAFDAVRSPLEVVDPVVHHVPPSRSSSITNKHIDMIFRACPAAVLYCSTEFLRCRAECVIPP